MSNSSYQNLKKRIADMSLRERVMICAVGVVLFMFPGFLVFVDANQQASARLQASIEQQRMEKDKLEAELQVWQARLTSNPNDAMREEIESLTEKIKTLDESLKTETLTLIDASLMTEILLNVMKVDGSLEVVALESSAPELVVKQKNISLYQHGVSITIRGTYLDVLKHLKALENQKYNFYWKSLDYKVQEYPYAEVKLELYTLSINKDFIRG